MITFYPSFLKNVSSPSPPERISSSAVAIKTSLPESPIRMFGVPGLLISLSLPSVPVNFLDSEANYSHR